MPKLRMPEKKTILWLMGAVLLIKLALVGIAAVSFNFAEQPHENWLTIWSRWDAKAYETIATYGYNPPPTVAAPDYRAFLSHFPPLYPLLTHLIPAPFPVASFLVSTVSGLLASYLLYTLVRADFGPETAVWAVLFLNLYPTSYFTLAPYTESVFLLLIIGSFWLLRMHPEKSWLAGLGIGASILTRLMGVVAVPALIVYVWQRIRAQKLSVSDVFLFFLPLGGLIMYFALNKVYFGDPLFFLKEYTTNAFSNKTLVYPFKYTIDVVWQGVTRLQEGPPLDYEYFAHHGWNAIFTILAAALVILGAIKRIPVIYTIYALAALLFFNLFDWGISNARYTLSIWPIFLVLALLPRPLRYSMAIVSACLLIYFTRIFTGGYWAF